MSWTERLEFFLQDRLTHISCDLASCWDSGQPCHKWGKKTPGHSVMEKVLRGSCMAPKRGRGFTTDMAWHSHTPSLKTSRFCEHSQDFKSIRQSMKKPLVSLRKCTVSKTVWVFFNWLYSSTDWCSPYCREPIRPWSSYDWQTGRQRGICAHWTGSQLTQRGTQLPPQKHSDEKEM